MVEEVERRLEKENSLQAVGIYLSLRHLELIRSSGERTRYCCADCY